MINSFRNQYRFLSNFYFSPIIMENQLWPTVEHYYQAMKCSSLMDQDTIRRLETPNKPKD